MTTQHRSLFTLTDDPPGFVLDSSVSYEWLPGTSAEAYTRYVLLRMSQTTSVVSFMWSSEMVTRLLVAERAGRVTASRADTFLSGFDVFRIILDEQRLNLTWPASLAVARRYRLRVGPAASLELALRTRLPLATIDTRLRTAATRAGVALFAP